MGWSMQLSFACSSRRMGKEASRGKRKKEREKEGQERKCRNVRGESQFGKSSDLET